MTERWRTIAAGGVLVSLMGTIGYVLRPVDTSPRKLLGEVVALKLYAGLDHPPSSAPISADIDSSTAAPGRPGAYRRAVRFHDPLLPCPEGAAPVTCGAKLEIFRRRSVAKEREQELADTTKEWVMRRGALVLRVSSELPHERATLYRTEFLSAIDELIGFRELARIDRLDG